MPRYSYEALDKGSRNIKGDIDAPNEEVVLDKLRGMGYYPVKIAKAKTEAGKTDLLAMPGLRYFFHKVKTKHIVTFTRQLATLIDAGLPILRSLSILSEQVESVIFKEVIIDMSTEIESGGTLSDAMAKHPKQFDKLFVNMIRAGEIGGVLEAVLNKIAEFLEKRQMLIGKVKAAMMYPLVVIILAGGIVTFILVFIMPKFQDIFAQLGADLPTPTRLLIQASNIMLHQTWIIGIIAFLIWFTYKKLNSNMKSKYYLDKIKLKLPVFGALLQKIAIARWASTLATLITSGVPILQALDIVRESSGNEVISKSMIEVYQSIKDGDTIHEPLARCWVFPPLVVHMIAVGEETGAIDQMLNKVAEAYEREVDDAVSALTSIIEPLLIVFLGVVVGGIVIALYLPLFNIPKAMGKQS